MELSLAQRTRVSPRPPAVVAALAIAVTMSAFLAPALLPARAASLPNLAIPDGMGVNIHFTRGHERDLDLIAAAGFKFVRMDFGWGGIERKKGEYNWSDYDELTANLERRKLRPLYILDYSNGLYEEAAVSKNPTTGKEQRATASPQHPESVAAFARWAAAAARHFAGREIIWEIWNEPNISFWKPKPDVEQYTTLALATLKAVRAADPKATIIGPASSEFPWPFLERFLSSGALEYLDAVSVHPYRNYKRGPETASEDYQRLRALIQQYAPKNKTISIISGEWGYATHTKGISPETQAAFIVRQQLANLFHSVPISIWYDWKNDGTDPAEREHNFGVVANDLTPKPAYRAAQTLAAQLGGYQVVRRVDLAAAEDFALLLQNQVGAQKLAVWTTAQPHAVTLALGGAGAEVVIVDGQGNTQSRSTSTEGRLVLPVEPAPLYLAMKIPAPLFPR